MFCEKCGKEIPDDSKFCPECGAAIAESAPGGVPQEPEVSEPETEAPEAPPAEADKPKRKRKKVINSQKDIEGEKITDNIYLCRDGVYRWVYEMLMMKNPTILFTVWKVFGMAGAIVFLFVFLLDVFENNVSGETMLGALKSVAVIVGIFLVLSIIAYIILAAVYGWKYVVLFEMDEDRIKHIQVPRQQSKAEVLGLITALAGLASKNLSTTGIGITAGTRSTSTTEYAYVKSIKSNRRRSVIRLSQGLSKNQIYADGSDFDFALDFISSRCPKAKK